MGELRNYELYVILRPDLDEEDVQTFVEHIAQLANDRQGFVGNVKIRDVRKLAYAIQKIQEGRDVIFQLRLPPGASNEIEKLLQLNESVLRYLTTQFSGEIAPEVLDSSSSEEAEEMADSEHPEEIEPEGIEETVGVESKEDAEEKQQ